MFLLSNNFPNFDRMINNPLCLQVIWYKNDEALDRWKEGKTGFPLIDAIMRQMRGEGWINHVQRFLYFTQLTMINFIIYYEGDKKY